MTANIRTSQRTVSAMQRFAVSQKNRTEAITISPFLLSLPYRTENRRFSALSCTKTGGTQPKLSAACFVVQSCLADADFVVFSDYCLIGTRPRAVLFCASVCVILWLKYYAKRQIDYIHSLLSFRIVCSRAEKPLLFTMAEIENVVVPVHPRVRVIQQSDNVCLVIHRRYPVHP